MKKSPKEAKPAKAETAAAGAAASAISALDLRRLTSAVAQLDTAANPADVAGQVVRLVAAQPGMQGARLWRLQEDQPAVWHQAGTLPEPQLGFVKDLFAGKGTLRGDAMWARALGSNGEVIGVLEARTAGKLDQPTREWLELFARIAGVTLVHTEKRREFEELSGIVEATKRLNSTLDLAELINIILQLAIKHTAADRGTVFLTDPEREEIWSLLGLGLEQQEIRLPMTKGIAGWVAREGQTVNLRDAYEDLRFEPEVDKRLGYRTRTLLCLPIRNKDNAVIGVLQLLNKRSGVFTAQDEGFLAALSDHVALALENAQLHRELLAKQRIERDLELARSIQRGLLPELPPVLEGFDIAVSHRSSQMVGGDYYDFVKITDETMLTVIADVEGKGVASGLVMANLQATLRALVAHLHSLERLVSAVNNMILADTRAQKFMTFFACMLDTRNRALHYINAGHVPPVVLRASGEKIHLSEGGMVMGVFPDVPYDRGFLALESGDIMVGCTDGITEAMNPANEEYGSERLVAAVERCRSLPAQKIVEAVLEDVEQFSRGGTHEDDRVIYILRVL
ncbi:MAG: PP2C family protein-serine/threonine phosphatase [Candidatus Acidiferrales bacterium]